MHIDPGIVTGAKLALSYVTGAAALSGMAKMSFDAITKGYTGAVAFTARSAVVTALVFSFFEILPHHPVGVSEVHLIFGSTLLLLFGTAPTAVGLALGLLIQGMFFAPFDLPQYGMNVTTLLVPLMGIHLLARRVISPDTAYVDLRYGQALALSTVYQGGIVAWVMFWTIWGEGFTATSMAGIATFGAAYMSVVLLEPLVDLAVLAVAKRLHHVSRGPLFERRLHETA